MLRGYLPSGLVVCLYFCAPNQLFPSATFSASSKHILCSLLALSNSPSAPKDDEGQQRGKENIDETDGAEESVNAPRVHFKGKLPKRDRKSGHPAGLAQRIRPVVVGADDVVAEVGRESRHGRLAKGRGWTRESWRMGEIVVGLARTTMPTVETCKRTDNPRLLIS